MCRVKLHVSVNVRLFPSYEPFSVIHNTYSLFRIDARLLFKFSNFYRNRNKIYFLQDTYFTEDDVNMVRSKWGFEIFISPGKD